MLPSRCLFGLQLQTLNGCGVIRSKLQNLKQMNKKYQKINITTLENFQTIYRIQINEITHITKKNKKTQYIITKEKKYSKSWGMVGR